MLIGEIISVALGALRANKLRSLLTMLGIVIGVAAVIAMVAIGSGAQGAVKDRINALGTTLLTVNPGQQRQAGVTVGGGWAKMTLDDAKALEEPHPRRTTGAGEPAAGHVPQQERESVGRRHVVELSRGAEVPARLWPDVHVSRGRGA
jgi:putative ABC transport system permease protein